MPLVPRDEDQEIRDLGEDLIRETVRWEVEQEIGEEER